MKLTVNGERYQTDARTIADLIAERGLAGQAVAVELNQQVVPKARHDQATLNEGDQVELVTLVGGG